MDAARGARLIFNDRLDAVVAIVLHGGHAAGGGGVGAGVGPGAHPAEAGQGAGELRSWRRRMRARTTGRRERVAAGGAAASVRRIAGMPDYAAHVEHLRRCHPDRALPDRARVLRGVCRAPATATGPPAAAEPCVLTPRRRALPSLNSEPARTSRSATPDDWAAFWYLVPWTDLVCRRSASIHPGSGIRTIRGLDRGPMRRYLSSRHRAGVRQPQACLQRHRQPRAGTVLEPAGSELRTARHPNRLGALVVRFEGVLGAVLQRPRRAILGARRTRPGQSRRTLRDEGLSSSRV